MKSVILLLVLLIAAFTNAYLTNIELDAQNGQVYVTSGNIIYELDSSSVQQNGVHYLPGEAEYDCFHVGKSGNKRVLFSYVDTATDEELVTIPVPLKNQQTLKTTKTASYPPGLSFGSTFDDTDKLAILFVSRNITLVDLNTLSPYDSIRIGRNRVFGYNLVYNHQNNHLIVFNSYVPVENPLWGLSVAEYDLSNHLFEEVNTTYDCLCGDGHDASESPFLHVEFPANTCEVDYSSNPARIWCFFTDNRQFFSFNAENLADFVISQTTVNFTRAMWDLANGFAYVIDYVNPDAGTGVTVSKVRLSNAAVLATYTNANIDIDASVAILDTEDHHLFIGGSSPDPNAAETLVSVNINNLAAANAAKVVTLNTNGL